VCASADVVVVVSDMAAHNVSVFDRGDGALLRCFAPDGSGDGQLATSNAVCLMSGDRHVAVADFGNDRVSVFSVDGEFIRHVGVGVLCGPSGVAASAFDELVVADTGNWRLRLFSSTGDLLVTVGDGGFTCVAVHGSTVLATRSFSTNVSVFI
jgi:tripartite motif-containing protein 2/3/tripartite motif-containing protein 56